MLALPAHKPEPFVQIGTEQITCRLCASTKLRVIDDGQHRSRYYQLFCVDCHFTWLIWYLAAAERVQHYMRGTAPDDHLLRDGTPV